MTVYGVITAAIVRKLRALIAEIRALVASATLVEKRIASNAKIDVEKIMSKAKADTKQLENELIDTISKL